MDDTILISTLMPLERFAAALHERPSALAGLLAALPSAITDEDITRARSMLWAHDIHAIRHFAARLIVNLPTHLPTDAIITERKPNG